MTHPNLSRRDLLPSAGARPATANPAGVSPQGLRPRRCLHLLAAVVVSLVPLPCLAQPAAALRLDLGAKAFELSLAGQRLASSQGDPLFVVLYSEAPTVWSARTWRMVGPDAELVAPTADGWTYEAKAFAGIALRVSARARVRQAEGDVTWDVRLENRSLGTAVGLIGPCLRNVQDRPGGFLAVPNRPGHRIDDPWNVLATAVQHLTYPVPASMQYLAYSSPGGGVAVHLQDPAMSYKQMAFGGPGRQMTFIQYPFVAPGGDWRSPPVVWQGLSTDWHAAADRYRAWFRSWAQRPQVSPTVRAMPIVPGIVIRARPQEDEFLKDVTKAQEVGTYEAAFAKVEDYARTAMSGVHLVGWFGQGHDSTYPDHQPAPEMGGEDGLLQLAALMKQRHLLAFYYLNARLLNAATSPSYRSHPEWAAVTENGQPRQERIGGETFHVACPACAGYRRHLTREVLRVARGYGGDGVQLDQIGAAWAVLCFESTHGHATPASAWASGHMALLDAITRTVRAVNPNFVCWTEGAWEGAGQYVDLSQGGFWPDHPGSKPFPQMYRYTLPEHPLFGDATLGGVPYWCPTDLARARRIGERVASVFLDGDFRDDLGLTVTGPGEAHWFRQGDEAVLCVLNRAGDNQTFDVVLKPTPPAPQPPYARAVAVAAGTEVPLTHTPEACFLRLSIPAGQVEAVLLTPAR